MAALITLIAISCLVSSSSASRGTSDPTSPYCAYVDGEYYVDLADAAYYAEDGSTITLLDDYDDWGPVWVNDKSIILDLNGHVLGKAGYTFIGIDGSLHLIGSDLPSKCAFKINYGGSLTIECGTFEGKTEMMNNNGDLTILDGVFSSDSTLITNGEDGNVRISGGAFTGDTLISNSGSATIDGDPVFESNHSIGYTIYNSGHMSIAGGAIMTVSGGCISNLGTLLLESGYLMSEENECILNYGHLELSGGTLRVSEDRQEISVGGGTILVDAGLYDSLDILFDRGDSLRSFEVHYSNGGEILSALFEEINTYDSGTLWTGLSLSQGSVTLVGNILQGSAHLDGYVCLDADLDCDLTIDGTAVSDGLSSDGKLVNNGTILKPVGCGIGFFGNTVNNGTILLEGDFFDAAILNGVLTNSVNGEVFINGCMTIRDGTVNNHGNMVVPEYGQIYMEYGSTLINFPDGTIDISSEGLLRGDDTCSIVNDGTISAYGSNCISVKNMSGDGTISIRSFTVQTLTDGNGSVKVTMNGEEIDGYEIPAGSDILILISPDPSYIIGMVTLNGSPVETDGTIEIQNLSTDIYVEALFEFFPEGAKEIVESLYDSDGNLIGTRTTMTWTDVLSDGFETNTIVTCNDLDGNLIDRSKSVYSLRDSGTDSTLESWFSYREDSSGGRVSENKKWILVHDYEKDPHTETFEYTADYLSRHYVVNASIIYDTFSVRTVGDAGYVDGCLTLNGVCTVPGGSGYEVYRAAVQCLYNYCGQIALDETNLTLRIDAGRSTEVVIPSGWYDTFQFPLNVEAETLYGTISVTKDTLSQADLGIDGSLKLRLVKAVETSGLHPYILDPQIDGQSVDGNLPVSVSIPSGLQTSEQGTVEVFAIDQSGGFKAIGGEYSDGSVTFQSSGRTCFVIGQEGDVYDPLPHQPEEPSTDSPADNEKSDTLNYAAYAIVLIIVLVGIYVVIRKLT